MSAQNKSVFELFDIISNDGVTSVDLVRGVISFSYYENILSPMITAKAIIVNTGNTILDKDDEMSSIYNGLPLSGGEKVNIKIHEAPEGSVNRRCPNIDKLKSLGHSKQVALREGLKITYDWYLENLEIKRS